MYVELLCSMYTNCAHGLYFIIMYLSVCTYCLYVCTSISALFSAQPVEVIHNVQELVEQQEQPPTPLSGKEKGIILAAKYFVNIYNFP